MLSKPLQPFWITPGSISADLLHPSPCSKIICCTASRFIDRPEASDGNYVQGAADDSESWAHGLTPSLFWQNSEQLLKTSEDALPALIQSLIQASHDSDSLGPQATLIQPTSTIFIGTTNAAHTDPFDASIICCPTPATPQPDHAEPATTTENSGEPRTLTLNCGAGKLGSRALRTQLSRVPPFIQALLARVRDPRILFLCSTGRDLSAGVALVVLCLYFSENGKLCHRRHRRHRRHRHRLSLHSISFKFECLIYMCYIGKFGSRGAETKVMVDKTFTRQRLAWLTSSKPDINPSRATLQAVNLFLMSGTGTGGV